MATLEEISKVAEKRAMFALKLRDEQCFSFRVIGTVLGVSPSRARQLVEKGRRIVRVHVYRFNDAEDESDGSEKPCE